MNSNDASVKSNHAIAHWDGASKSDLMRGDAGKRSDNNSKDYFIHWKVLLGEFIHLLSLFWVHSQTAITARASEVLFNQLLQHSDILKRMPKNDGGILVRRIHYQPYANLSSPDYLVLFGSVMINSKEKISSEASRQLAQLKRTLGKAFESFAEQGIHSLHLRLPGRSLEKIEQFRFSLHILTRYYMAASEGTSVAFRYYGRSLTVPLITGANGLADPNLTVMAALNGLSTINARELIKQADAYHKINMSDTTDLSKPVPPVDYYDRIFKVRSLRSQIIRPPVEINRLIRPDALHKVGLAPLSRRDRIGQAATQAGETGPGEIEKFGDASKQIGEKSSNPVAAVDRHNLVKYVNEVDPQLGAELDALFAADYADLDPADLGKRFADISRLLFYVDKQHQNPAVTESFLEILREKMRAVPDEVLAEIITQRQSLKIIHRARTVLVGLVHPRLFDLISLIKEHVVAQQRMLIIKEIAFNVDPCHMNTMADGFGISVSEAHQIFGLLGGCFGGSGSFIRSTFESRIDAMTRHENVIFEVLWCFLKQTPQRKDRLNFLNAIQLLMARLNDPKRALQFLLADICQYPSQIDFTDRNAFALANVLLHKENKELYIDVNRTPEDVLKIQRPLNKEVRRYAVWRLEVDQGRFLGKMRTIAGMAHKVLTGYYGNERKPFELTFLMALEREAFIFSALIGGYTARLVLREAMRNYADPDAAIYRHESLRQHLSQLILHLQIIVRALGRIGNYHDIEQLRALERKADLFVNLDSHPAHGIKVKQMLKWIPETVKMIQSSNI